MRSGGIYQAPGCQNFYLSQRKHIELVLDRPMAFSSTMR